MIHQWHDKSENKGSELCGSFLCQTADDLWGVLWIQEALEHTDSGAQL